MNQSEIDQLMQPKDAKREKSPAMKSRLGPREIKSLGVNAQVWAIRIYGVMPTVKRIKALELVSVCLTNGTETIYLTAADFGPSARIAAAPPVYTAEDAKAGRPRIPRAPFRGVSLETFAQVLYDKLPDTNKKTRLVLVTFGTAENYGPLDLHDLDARITYHPVGASAYALKFFDKKKGFSLEFLDLAAFFPDRELADVAETYDMGREVGEPKRPKEDDMHSRAYALQDARLTWRIFSTLRADMVKAWGVDPAVYRTPASCAARVYTSQYLKRSPGAVTRQVRLQAMRCYWGGRIEAFFRGRMEGEICVYDAISLYPQACINLGALPTADSWYRLTMRTLKTCAGGMCTVSFKFPDTEVHPCLPVQSGGKNYYPLSGISSCTAHEVRYALECGATVELLEGWGYDAENGDTSLAEYSADMLSRKNMADRAGDFSSRTMFKLMMNSLYGKFGQHHIGHSLDTLREICREYEYPDIPTLLKTPNWEKEIAEETGEIIEPEVNISDYWYPEWATLINGYARMIESKAMREYVALTGTVDSVILSGNAGDFFLIDGVRFKRERIGDTLVSVRARLYVVTDAGQVVKAALHGAPQVAGMAELLAGWNWKLRRKRGRGEKLRKKAEQQGHEDERLTIYAVRVRQLREGLTQGQVIGSRQPDKPQTVELGWDERRQLTGNYSEPYPFLDSKLDLDQLDAATEQLRH